MIIRLSGILFLALLIFGAISYANGWIKLERSGDTTTIEMKTDEMKDATNKAIDKGKELIDKAGDKIQEFGDDNHDDSPVQEVGDDQGADNLE